MEKEILERSFKDTKEEGKSLGSSEQWLESNDFSLAWFSENLSENLSDSLSGSFLNNFHAIFRTAVERSFKDTNKEKKDARINISSVVEF